MTLTYILVSIHLRLYLLTCHTCHAQWLFFQHNSELTCYFITFGRYYQLRVINFFVLYKNFNIIIGTLLCTCSFSACYHFKSVKCDLGDVVKNRAISIQKLHTGRKSRTLGKLCAGIKCADQPPYLLHYPATPLSPLAVHLCLTFRLMSYVWR